MPLILGTLNLLGMYTYPLGTNFFFILFFVFMVLLAAYSSKPSVGGTYHFGPEGVESANFTDFAGRPLSIFIAILETLGLVIKGVSVTTRMTANLTAGHILTGLLYGNGCAFPHKALSVGVLVCLIPFGLALMTLEICVCYVQGYVFCTLLTEYWYGYTRP